MALERSRGCCHEQTNSHWCTVPGHAGSPRVYYYTATPAPCSIDALYCHHQIACVHARRLLLSEMAMTQVQVHVSRGKKKVNCTRSWRACACTAEQWHMGYPSNRCVYARTLLITIRNANNKKVEVGISGVHHLCNIECISILDQLLSRHLVQRRSSRAWLQS